jgi:hypothetical protein
MSFCARLTILVTFFLLSASAQGAKAAYFTGLGDLADGVFYGIANGISAQPGVGHGEDEILLPV